MAPRDSGTGPTQSESIAIAGTVVTVVVPSTRKITPVPVVDELAADPPRARRPRIRGMAPH